MISFTNTDNDLSIIEIIQLKEILFQSNDKIAGRAQELSMNNE